MEKNINSTFLHTAILINEKSGKYAVVATGFCAGIEKGIWNSHAAVVTGIYKSLRPLILDNLFSGLTGM